MRKADTFTECSRQARYTNSGDLSTVTSSCDHSGGASVAGMSRMFMTNISGRRIGVLVSKK